MHAHIRSLVHIVGLIHGSFQFSITRHSFVAIVVATAATAAIAASAVIAAIAATAAAACAIEY